MLIQNFPIFLLLSKLGSHCGAFTLKWDEKSSKMHIVSDKKTSRNETFKRYLQNGLTCIIIIQTILGFAGAVKNAESNPVSKILLGVTLVVLLTGASFLKTCKKNATEVALCVNGHIQFNKKYKNVPHRNSGRTFIEKLNLLFAYTLPFTGSIHPFVIIYGVHSHHPCGASLAGYWLLKECRNGNSSSENFVNQTIIKLALLVANHYVWILAANMISFTISAFQILCTMSLKDDLNKFLNLACLRHRRERISIYEVGLTYRTIQAQAQLANLILRETLLTLVIAAIPIGAIGLASFVRLDWSSENLLPLIVALVVTINASFSLVVLLGGMVGVYLKSKKSFETLKWKLCEMTNPMQRFQWKWLTRFYKSCKLIRINLGRNNFLEAMTPLKCVDLMVSLTTQLLLILDN